ncbi:hypothetical protein EV363DRAFT_1132823, partial [Boletus edulis]
DTTNCNLQLLTGDLVYVLEPMSAISDRDFGRVKNMLGHLWMIFRGAGSKNYCLEIHYFLFN